MERLVYKFDIITKSPLSVGTAYNDLTDHDIATYSDGTPYVPATSLCGSFFARLDYENSKNDKQILFGTNPEDKKDFIESKLFVSDGIFINFNKDAIKLRDFNRVASDKDIEDIQLEEKSNGKFDSLYINEDSRFSFFIVYTQDNENIENLLKEQVIEIAQKINSGLYRLGNKQNRGFGKLFVDKLVFKKYDKSNYADYLDFNGDVKNIKDFEDFKEIKIEEKEFDGIKSFSVKAKLKGSILVREYQLLEEIDYGPITTTVGGKKVAVVPATSINGVLQERVRKIAKELNVKYDKDDLINTIVDEAYIYDGDEKQFSRNKINRFTSNAIDKGLYTEKVWFSNDNSYCEFNIRFKDTMKDDSNIYRLYYLALQDLLLGYAPIGGETNIGRGIFEGKVEDIVVKAYR